MYNHELIQSPNNVAFEFLVNCLKCFSLHSLYFSHPTECLGNSICHEFRGNLITLILAYKYTDLDFLTFTSVNNDKNITYMFYREPSYSQLCSLRYRFRSHGHKGFVNSVHRFHCSSVHIHQAHMLQFAYKSMYSVKTRIKKNENSPFSKSLNIYDILQDKNSNRK